MVSRRLLPEWAPQAAVVLSWPGQIEAWRPWRNDIESTYVELVRQIAITTPVTLLVQDHHTATYAQDLVGQCKHDVRYHAVPFDDTWVRDYGPISVRDETGIYGLDFHFNAWGQKYEAKADNLVTQQILHQIAPHYRYEPHSVTLEGGAIETNGEGLLLATPDTLVGPSRNPGMNIHTMVTELSPLLGVIKWTWLPDIKLAGDDTDGHVDTLARFLDPYCLCYVSENSEADLNVDQCQKLRDWALHWQAEDTMHKTIELPNPKPIHNAQGEPLPATYANFLITNGQVIVPTYDDPNDEIAMRRIAHLCPHYVVSGINARTLIEQFGSIHCATIPIFH